MTTVGSGTNTSTNTSTNTGQSSNAHTASTQPTEVETYEEHAEPEYIHLDQDNPPPPTAIPKRKHRRIKDWLNKVSAIPWRKSKH